MLSRLRRFRVPAEDLAAVYIGYVRPICEYAVPVWHSNINADQSILIERIQKRACLGSKYDRTQEHFNSWTSKRLKIFVASLPRNVFNLQGTSLGSMLIRDPIAASEAHQQILRAQVQHK